MAAANGLRSRTVAGNYATGTASIAGCCSNSDERELSEQSGCQVYNAGRRTRQDNIWTVAYCLLAGLAACWSIVSLTHEYVELEGVHQHSKGFYGHSTSCDWQAYSANTEYVDKLFGTASAVVQGASTIVLPITCVAGLLLAVTFAAMFIAFPRAMLQLWHFGTTTLGLMTAASFFFSGELLPGIAALAVVVLLAGYCSRCSRQIGTTCSELLALAGRALTENGRLVAAAVGVKLAGGVLLALLLVGCLHTHASFAATGVPHINPAAVQRTQLSGDFGVCKDHEGLMVACCSFKEPAWGHAYLLLCVVAAVWTVQLMLAINLHVVANVVAQWYFAPKVAAGSDGQRGGSVMRALRHGLTSGFGTAAFAAAGSTLALVVVVVTVKVWQLMVSDTLGSVAVVVLCLLPALIGLHTFERFATIGAGLSGQGLVASAKAVLGTLRRNMLQTHILWCLPGFALYSALLVITSMWTFLVAAFVAGYSTAAVAQLAFYPDTDTTNSGSAGHSNTLDDVMMLNNSRSLYTITVVGGSTAVVGTASVLVVFLLLNLVASLLLDSVNTLYICHVMDRDQRAATHPDQHAAYKKLPSLASAPGSVVQNPDGDVVYGAAEEQPLMV